MAITVKRKKREIRDHGTITQEFTGADVGKSIDFMGVPTGFRVVDVNLTVDEVFDNADNKISVGIEGDLTRFIGQSDVNAAVAGFAFNNRQFTATAATGIVADIVGSASTGGKATVTVRYAKLPVSRQEY
jgi:hypothetical protein